MSELSRNRRLEEEQRREVAREKKALARALGLDEKANYDEIRDALEKVRRRRAKAIGLDPSVKPRIPSMLANGQRELLRQLGIECGDENWLGIVLDEGTRISKASLFGLPVYTKWEQIEREEEKDERRRNRVARALGLEEGASWLDLHDHLKTADEATRARFKKTMDDNKHHVSFQRSMRIARTGVWEDSD